VALDGLKSHEPISVNVPFSDELFLDDNKSSPPEFMGSVPDFLCVCCKRGEIQAARLTRKLFRAWLSAIALNSGYVTPLERMPSIEIWRGANQGHSP